VFFSAINLLEYFILTSIYLTPFNNNPFTGAPYWKKAALSPQRVQSAACPSRRGHKSSIKWPSSKWTTDGKYIYTRSYLSNLISSAEGRLWNQLYWQLAAAAKNGRCMRDRNLFIIFIFADCISLFNSCLCFSWCITNQSVCPLSTSLFIGTPSFELKSPPILFDCMCPGRWKVSNQAPVARCWDAVYQINYV